MVARIALVALGRSPLPTGKTLLEAELAEDVDVRALDAALAARDVEIQVLPAPAPRPQPDRPETTVAPVPLGPVPFQAEPALAEPEETESDPDETDVVEVASDEPADPLAGKSEDEVREELEAAVSFDDAVKALVKANTRDELIELAEEEEVTFSYRANMTKIATDIVEKRRAG